MADHNSQYVSTVNTRGCYNPAPVGGAVAHGARRRAADGGRRIGSGTRRRRGVAAGRDPRRRPDAGDDRALLHDDARRPRRRRDQDRAAGQGATTPAPGGRPSSAASRSTSSRSTATSARSRSTSSARAGKEALWRLIDGADVLVENFSPGTIGRLGFGYEAVRARKPDIVYASISGFGQTGPGDERTAYDLIVQGMGGMMSDHRPRRRPADPARRPDRRHRRPACSPPSPSLGALFHRERTGEGQYVDTSMLGGQVALLTYQAGHLLRDRRRRPASSATPTRSSPPTTPSTPPTATSTSRSATTGSGPASARALGLEELLADERFADQRRPDHRTRRRSTRCSNRRWRR